MQPAKCQPPTPAKNCKAEKNRTGNHSTRQMLDALLHADLRNSHRDHDTRGCVLMLHLVSLLPVNCLDAGCLGAALPASHGEC